VEFGLFRAEVLWDYSCVQFVRKLAKDGTSPFWRAVKADYENVAPSRRGKSVGGAFQLLEVEWGVPMSGSCNVKKRRNELVKKSIGGVAERVLQRKGGTMGPSSYLWCDRATVASLVRFRLEYGPDLVSLRKRGLHQHSDQCRLCGAVEESVDHLLNHCGGTTAVVPRRPYSVEEVLRDQLLMLWVPALLAVTDLLSAAADGRASAALPGRGRGAARRGGGGGGGGRGARARGRGGGLGRGGGGGRGVG
jgi:uncharacterized membrane protein YgcG